MPAEFDIVAAENRRLAREVKELCANHCDVSFAAQEVIVRRVDAPVTVRS